MHRFTDMTDLKRGVVVVRSLGVGWRAVWWAGVIGTPHTAAAIAATTALDANARSHIHCARSRTGLCVFFSSEQDEGRSSSFRRLWSIVVRGYFWGSSNDPLKLQRLRRFFMAVVAASYCRGRCKRQDGACAWAGRLDSASDQTARTLGCVDLLCVQRRHRLVAGL